MIPASLTRNPLGVGGWGHAGRNDRGREKERKDGEEEQVRGEKVWMKAREECAKQHLPRRKGGDGCGCKREKAFPNNICNECNICRRRVRREGDAIMDGFMVV